MNWRIDKWINDMQTEFEIQLSVLHIDKKQIYDLFNYVLMPARPTAVYRFK